ncbi:hypothetical protein NF716_04635 [Lactococcus formosensis]|uniref:hypothetical protein n=1 Tax=Lactococcus formosensis TaxID=1281486 RepID=UPI0024354561|nr:hypothetical protein [Lactococcus formosensis]MDG6155641.1 hypothetical protein [Lactococcus formosensis]
MKRKFDKNIKGIGNLVALCTIVFITAIAFIILDYNNFPSYLGMKVVNINWDFLAIVISNCIVVLLYLITYFVLDRRSIIREKNKNEVAYLLIKKSYEEVRKQADFMTIEIVKKYVVPKIDFKSTDNTLVNNMCNAPFEDENLIFELVKDGQISKELLNGYISVKKSYSIYINSIITFFDAEEIYIPMKEEFYKTLDREVNNIENNFKY